MSPQPINPQRVVPCECGSREAYWHGPEGRREYSCAPCFNLGDKKVSQVLYRIEAQASLLPKKERERFLDGIWTCLHEIEVLNEIAQASFAERFKTKYERRPVGRQTKTS